MWHTDAMEMTEKQKATQRKNKTGKIGSVRRDEIENEENCGMCKHGTV